MFDTQIAIALQSPHQTYQEHLNTESVSIPNQEIIDEVFSLKKQVKTKVDMNEFPPDEFIYIPM